MKPRNKKQQHIVELSGRLRPLTTPQMNWALNSTINHYGYRLKNGMCTCMKCGHEWLETRNGTCLCHECGTQERTDQRALASSMNVLISPY